MEWKKWRQYTRKVQEYIPRFVELHWLSIAVGVVGFVIIFGLVPIPFIDHSKHPYRNWQNLGNWATYFYSISAFVTLLVVLAGAVLAMRQLKFMDRTQKLQIALRLFDEFKEIEKLEASRKLYENFCEHGK